MAVGYGCAYDTFLSYAHVDNEPVVLESNIGWVSVFYKTLELEVRQRTGRKIVALWKDDKLRYDESLSRQLTETVQTSAILVVMLSPGYVNSDWCRREREAFFKAAPAGRDAPVIVIVKEPMEDKAIPDELRDRKRFHFYGGPENITFGYPLPHLPVHQNFYDKILELSREITRVLKSMSAVTPTQPQPNSGAADHPQEPLPPRPPTPLIRRRVFLAETTDDLEEERDNVRAFLDQHGVEVLPPAGIYYPRDAAAFREKAIEHLCGSELFVQLLSASRGKRPRDVPQGYPNLQWELATASSAGSNPVLQWCSPSLDISLVKDEHIGRLLRSPTVRAESLVDFEHAILAALTPKPKAVALVPGTVCVNVDDSDSRLAAQIQSILKRLGTDIDFIGSSPAHLKELRKSLSECDGVIVVYGEAEVTWVNERLRACRKSRAYRGADRPYRALGIFQGPPPEAPVDKPRPTVYVNGLEDYDCRGPTGDDTVIERKVRAFLDRLNAA